jgi:Iron-sulfur cluster-binding domain
MPTLEITTVASCTIRCTFCPQDALKENYPSDTAHRLSIESFKTVLGKLPPYVRVDFSGFVEPWLNPDCTEMLALALGAGFSVSVYTTLQGMRDPARVVELLEVCADRVEVLCLHLPDAHGNMTGHKDDLYWRQALNEFMALHRRGAIKRFEFVTMSDAGEMSAVIPVDRLIRWEASDRAGTLPRGAVSGQRVEPPVEHAGALGCSFTPFYDQNVLLPNGDVVLCCNDYSLRHKLGNLLEQSYLDLFAGQVMGHIRSDNMNFQGDPGRTLCGTCARATRYQTTPVNRQMWSEKA